MQNNYRYNIRTPNFGSLGYLTATANTQDKHDRSAPSHFHWKILKCRMIIFSNSSILACPDKKDEQQVHIVFNKMGDDYDKLVSLFMKFALFHHGYRLPEEECSYFTVRFWRGEPLTYPKICVLRHFPLVTPVPKPTE
ncbi:Uncharacterized protein OBRU01_08036, partial [Operophtera brumata]